MLTDTIHSPNSKALDPQRNPRQILEASDLKSLNRRLDRSGTLQFTAHLGVILLSGYLWAVAPLWLGIPALMVNGVGFALMFCAMHEGSHRTAFASVKANDAMAWVAGLLSFYNSTFYRRYHKWHHRYTQIPGKDPELDDPKPETVGQYLWQLSGIPWWWGKFKGHFKVALGNLEGCYFLPETSHQDVIRSTRIQLGVYGAIALITSLLAHPWFIVLHWLIPLAVGQPLLRFILWAEHTGCSNDANPLTNTRTTLTLWPLRFLMWNMPYHAEHHLYPSIPFHALPAAHQVLKPYFERVESGYLHVNQSIIGVLK
ncbi:MAG: fatty acid desaturase [Merismopedia sp. SIO2A8]|nr:fatty acid desaturase [Symploca sp. SIO2B6]NET48066.1 fatty acid desaturase [Merismopedia sp. SIO2A8]